MWCPLKLTELLRLCMLFYSDLELWPFVHPIRCCKSGGNLSNTLEDIVLTMFHCFGIDARTHGQTDGVYVNGKICSAFLDGTGNGSGHRVTGYKRFRSSQVESGQCIRPGVWPESPDRLILYSCTRSSRCLCLGEFNDGTRSGQHSTGQWPDLKWGRSGHRWILEPIPTLPIDSNQWEILL